MINHSLKKFIVAALQTFFAQISHDITNSLPKGKILVIAPHPDDETFGCGATIARLVDEGRNVIIVCVTDGSASTYSEIIKPEELGAIRREELKNAVNTRMGSNQIKIIFLNYPDSQASAHVAAIAHDLEKQIRLFNPVAVFMPYGIDINPDHKAVSAASDQALKETNYRGKVYAYPIWFWPKGALKHMLYLGPLFRHQSVRVGEYFDRKQAAIASHRSQVENLTGEACWARLTPEFINHFTGPYELFFEKRLNS